MGNNIQFISENFKENDLNITVSTFNNFKAFNSFDFNIIDLNEEYLWGYDDIREEYRQNSLLSSLKDSIVESNNKTKFIFLIPQNLKIDVNLVEKDYLNYNRELVENYLYSVCKVSFSLIFGNNVTKIDGKDIISDFYFAASDFFEVVTNNVNGDATLIQKNNYILTTLFIDDITLLNDVIMEINNHNKKTDVPDWIDEFKFFRDQDQLNLIELYENKIKNIEDKINTSKDLLAENDKFKSILYTKGDVLVSVVFEILEELLDCDLSGFVDVYDEDFYIEKEDISFIGEIKGVNTNAKNKHLSQLNDHAVKKADKLKEEGITHNFKQILIINTFRDIHPDERPEIEDETINKAKNMYQSLIIKTADLLKLFEMFKKEQITSGEVIERFKDEIGLFKIEYF